MFLFENEEIAAFEQKNTKESIENEVKWLNFLFEI